MSLKINGKKCPICNGDLSEKDEIVWCPECGAPHHKECYIAAGECGFSKLHGTKEIEEKLNTPIIEQEKQVNNDEQAMPKINIRCTSCGAAFPIDYERCPNCSAENKAKDGRFFMFDMLGGVKKSEDIGEGVNGEQAGKFVQISPHRFVPKFLAIKNGRKHFFSLWSFFFPSATFALRKMYPVAFLSGLLEIAATLLMFPLSLAIAELGLEKYEDMYAYIQAGVSSDVMKLTYLAFVGMAIMFICKLFCSFNFDRIYYKHTVSTIKEIEAEVTDDEERIEQYRKKGGVSIIAFAVALLLLQYVPVIIAEFIL